MNNSTQLGGLESIDLEALHAELAQVGAMHNDVLRREAIAKIQAVALLDIAGSLRVLAGEASLAMFGSGAFGDVEDLAVDEADERPEREFLLVGDLVKRRGDDDSLVGVVTGVGITEGEPYADVSLGADGMDGRAWQRDLERVPGVESDPLADEESDEEGDDFTPPATALDALREAEKKPAKKKGKKS